MILPLVIGFTPSLQWGDTPLKANLPPVVITGKSTYQVIESRQIPIPSPVLPGSKEHPEIAVSTTTAPEIPDEGKQQPLPKSPGCTYRNAFTTKVATLFKKDEAYDQRGKYLFLNRRYAEAIDTFRHLIETYPESRKIGEAYFWVGECYFQIDDLSQAEQNFKVVLQRYPTSLYADYACYSLGWIAYKKRLFHQAIKFFKEGVLAYPNSTIHTHMLFWLGEAYLQCSDMDKALTTFKEFLQKSRENTLRIPALFEVAKIKFFKKAYSESKKILEGLFAYNIPPSLLPKIYLLQGWCEYFMKDFQCQSTFTKILQLPHLTKVLKDEALYGQCLCDIQQKNPAAAEAVLEREGRAFPWYGEVAIALANYYFSKGDYKKAGDCCAKIFQNFSKSPYVEKAYFILGNSAYNTKDYSHATEYYTRVILGNVESLRPMAIYAKGLSFYQMGMFKDAIDSWEILLKKFPGFTKRYETLYWLGSACLNLKKDQAAIGYFERLKEKPGMHAKALIQLAQYWFGQQAWKSALRVIERFLALYPDNVYSGVAKGMMGEIYFNLKSYRKASRWLQKAIQDPHTRKNRELHAKLVFIKGQIAYRQGDFEEAIRLFDVVSTKLPTTSFSDDAYYWKAMSYYSLRRYKESISTLKELIRRFPESPLIPDAYLKIADCYYNLKEYAKSNAYYKKVGSLSGKGKFREKAVYGRILSFYQRKAYPEFTREALKFIHKYPTSSLVPDVVQLLGEYYDQRGEIDKEIELLVSFLKAHKNSLHADSVRLKLAKLYTKKQLFNSALVQLRIISLKNPPSPFRSVAEKEMGDLYYQQKLYREAIRHYQAYLKSVRISPILKQEVKTKLVMAHIHLGDFRRAEKELAQGATEFGVEWAAPLYLRLGKIYEKKRRLKAALSLYKKASMTTREGEKCTAMISMADVYRKWKKYDKSLKMLLMVRYSYPKCKGKSERALLRLATAFGKSGRKEEALQLIEVLKRSSDNNIRRQAKKILKQLK